jgi:hypothetical protein
MARSVVGPNAMKAKAIEVILHKPPSGNPPASASEDPINGFPKRSPNLQVVATHLNTLCLPNPAPCPVQARQPSPFSPRSFTRDGKRNETCQAMNHATHLVASLR